MDIDMREVYKPKDIIILRREKADLLLLINKGECQREPNLTEREGYRIYKHDCKTGRWMHFASATLGGER
jgi:hypothetical protein